MRVAHISLISTVLILVLGVRWQQRQLRAINVTLEPPPGGISAAVIIASVPSR